MKITMVISDFGFNYGEFNKAVEKFLKKTMYDAATIWLKTAVPPDFPVRTGFLKGSFGGLEDVLGLAKNQISVYKRLKTLKKGEKILDKLKAKHESIEGRKISGGKGKRVAKKSVDSDDLSQAQQDKLSIKKRQLEQQSEFKQAAKTKKLNDLEFKIKNLERRLSEKRARLAKQQRHAALLVAQQAARGKVYNPIVGYKFKGERKIFPKPTEKITLRDRVELTKAGLAEIEKRIADAKLKKSLLDRKLTKEQKLDKERARRRLYRDTFREFIAGNQTHLFRRQQISNIVARTEPVFGFNEYYEHVKGFKTLKTPYSGIKYTFPQDRTKYFTFSENKLPYKPIELASGREVAKGSFSASDVDNLLKNLFSSNKFKPVLRFNFSNVIRYYNKIDIRIGSRFVLAQQKMIAHIQKEINNFPKIADYLLKRTVTYDGKTLNGPVFKVI